MKYAEEILNKWIRLILLFLNMIFRYPMRGNSLFWNKPENNPDWVLNLSGEELLKEMLRRVNYTVPRYSNA